MMFEEIDEETITLFQELADGKKRDEILKMDVSKSFSFLPKFICPNLVGEDFELIRKSTLLMMVTQRDTAQSRMRLHELLVGEPGCFPEGTLVCMADGTYKKIETFGDYHLQPIHNFVRKMKDGSYRKIEETAHIRKIRKNSKEKYYTTTTLFHKYKNIQCYEIETNTRRKIQCSYIQPFWKMYKDTNPDFFRKKTYGKWVKANELKIGDSIRVAEGITNTRKSYVKIKPKNLYQKQKTRVENENKTYILNEGLASLFGYAFGDGWAHKHEGIPYEFSLIVNEEEKDLIPKLISLCKKELGITPKLEWKKPQPVSYIEGRKIQRTQKLAFLRIYNLGIGSLFYFLQEKAKIREFPEEILMSKKSVVTSFLKWYFEADGCVCISNRRRKISLKSSNIKSLEIIQLLLLGYGIQAMIHLDNLTITGHDTIKFAKRIGFVSKKKQNTLNKLLTFRDSNRSRTKKEYERIIKITDIGKKTVYDLTTDSHEFIANGFKVHNSGKTAFMLDWNEHFDGVFINGEHASKAGLCGDARGSGTPGLLTTFNGYTVLIDELDKMQSRDQSGLLQALGEGKYTVTKGKIHETYPAEIRAMASANKVDKIQRPLLDRFDFVYHLNTPKRKERADTIPKIVNSFFGEVDKKKTKTVELYLKWIEDFKPEVVKEDLKTIYKFLQTYVTDTHTDIDKISRRNLEYSILRIAYALAKLEQKNITKDHMKQAILFKDKILSKYKMGQGQ